jgi:hypothetical protein
MKRLLLIALVVLVIGCAAGTVFLGTWDIPPPSTTQERVIPNDRFAR